IYHSAAYGATNRNQQDVDSLIKTNFIGSVNLLDSLIKNGFDIFINPGSSLEYGLLNKEFEENDLPNPIDLYGVTKLAFTNYCRMLSLTENLPIVTLRIFFSYGYYESLPKLIPSLIFNILKNKDITLNTPYAKRDWFFIEDLIAAFIKTTKKMDNIPNGTILNIGSGNEYTVMEVFELLKEITDYKKDPIINENYLLKDKLSIWKANINKAVETINWKPEYNLKEGLVKTVEWFKKNITLYEDGE
ncbi:MAG: NAD-dependent epimerase/dehydratase family protein, partial [Caldisphaera sp.]